MLVSASFLASANALGSGAPSSQSYNQFVVSPPKILVNSIEFLQNNPGMYSVLEKWIVVSENGTIKIADSSGNNSVSVFNTSTQSAEYQYKLVYNQTYEGLKNTTVIFLKSTNGYSDTATNEEGQLIGNYNVSTVNTTTSAMILVEYPIFATARVTYNLSAPDIITPPPGGGLSGYYAENHTVVTYEGNQENQAWFNVTIWFYFNSAGNPVFVSAWMNMTAEASGKVSQYDFFQNEYNISYTETAFYITYEGSTISQILKLVQTIVFM